MAWRQSGAKPLPEPMMIICQWDTEWQTLSPVLLRFEFRVLSMSHSIVGTVVKMLKFPVNDWNYCLQNGSNFVPVSMCSSLCFQLHQHYLDRSTPYTTGRWVFWVVLTLTYCIRVYILQVRRYSLAGGTVFRLETMVLGPLEAPPSRKKEGPFNSLRLSVIYMHQ